MADVICKEVVITTLARRGAGVPGDPVRVITQVYDKDGTLIAEYDPSPTKLFSVSDVVKIGMAIAEKGIPTGQVTPELVKDWLGFK